MKKKRREYRGAGGVRWSYRKDRKKTKQSLKKGTSLFNVILFIGAWATLKIPMFLFGTQFLGVRFSTTRWVCSLIGILLIAFVTDRMHSEAEKQAIYLKHQQA